MYYLIHIPFNVFLAGICREIEGQRSRFFKVLLQTATMYLTKANRVVCSLYHSLYKLILGCPVSLFVNFLICVLICNTVEGRLNGTILLNTYNRA